VTFVFGVQDSVDLKFVRAVLQLLRSILKVDCWFESNPFSVQFQYFQYARRVWKIFSRLIVSSKLIHFL